MEMVRAYSTLEIKAAQDASGKRTFSGIASTPSTDRMGDIVEPKGAEFNLPLPFLWQHDSRDPIGWVQTAKVTAKGIEITGEIADIAEPGPLKDRLLLAWQMMQAKLVQGLSIGFSVLAGEPIPNARGYRYTAWSWHELSAVTVPANADCSITAIKSADQAMRRASLGISGRPVIRLDKPAQADPGVSGSNRRPGVIYLN